ncbi:MAG: methyltransferase type 12, partial [Acidobacteriota bacterium]
QFLYTNFDAVIGHHRRYTASTLGRVLPPGLETVKLHYLDSMGFFASLGNRLLLRQAMPDLKQILLWDGLLVRLSRYIDPLLGYRAGKTVLYVGRRPEET